MSQVISFHSREFVNNCCLFFCFFFKPLLTCIFLVGFCTRIEYKERPKGIDLQCAVQLHAHPPCSRTIHVIALMPTVTLHYYLYIFFTLFYPFIIPASISITLAINFFYANNEKSPVSTQHCLVLHFLLAISFLILPLVQLFLLCIFFFFSYVNVTFYPWLTQ